MAGERAAKTDDDLRIMAVAHGVWKGQGDHRSLSVAEWDRAEKLLEDTDLGKQAQMAAPTMAHAEAARVLMQRAGAQTTAGNHKEAESLRQRAQVRQAAAITDDRPRDARGRFTGK